MVAKSLMIQGTTSDAGKTTLALGICRLLKREGRKVAPFKPQNMALNSAVTIDGGEIGRAQALQAIACGIEPLYDMNPILLKPSSDRKAQVIVHGKVWKTLDAREYHAAKPDVIPFALQSFARMQQQYECIVVEGAGSPAEINLRANDIANMGFAEATDTPVLLVSDIDRGGVFAHLYGTYKLLSPPEQGRIIGFVINKFRGDVSLLDSGLAWLEKETNRRVLGVMPYLPGMTLDAEDSMGRKTISQGATTQLRIVVPNLPRMSNHTDFQPLSAESAIHLRYCDEPPTDASCDLIILPGSKSVVADLDWLRAKQWEPYIKRHLRYGGKVLGVCGGFQMLGTSIKDPHAVESDCAETCGLGLFDMTTELRSEKRLAKVSGRFVALGGAEIDGYEIHMGASEGAALSQPAMHLGEASDGAVSDDKQLIGTYVHGLFDKKEAREALYEWCGHSPSVVNEDFDVQREASIDRVADAIIGHCDWRTIAKYFDV